MVELVQLQVAIYFNRFELVPPDQCQARCHEKATEEMVSQPEKH